MILIELVNEISFQPNDVVLIFSNRSELDDMIREDQRAEISTISEIGFFGAHGFDLHDQMDDYLISEGYAAIECPLTLLFGDLESCVMTISECIRYRQDARLCLYTDEESTDYLERLVSDIRANMRFDERN